VKTNEELRLMPTHFDITLYLIDQLRALIEKTELTNDVSAEGEFKELVTQHIIKNREPPTNLSVSVDLFAKMYNDGLIESLGGNTWHYNFITLSIKD